MKMMQVELERPSHEDEDASGTVHTVCWLPLDDVRPTPGMLVSLVGEDKSIWKIARTFMTIAFEELHRDWRVGGLVRC